MDDALTLAQEHAQIIAGSLCTILAGLLVRLWAWIRKDRTTAEQRQLFDGLMRMLAAEDVYTDWTIVARDGIALFDADKHLLCRIDHDISRIDLGGQLVQDLLTGSERRQIMRRARQKERTIRETQHAFEMAQAIALTRRP